MYKFIHFYFIIILILIFLANFSFYNSKIEKLDISNNSEFKNSNFHYNSNSEYSWPLFGYYSVSSYFGKRISPVSRSFNISHRH